MKKKKINQLKEKREAEKQRRVAFSRERDAEIAKAERKARELVETQKAEAERAKLEKTLHPASEPCQMTS